MKWPYHLMWLTYTYKDLSQHNNMGVPHKWNQNIWNSPWWCCRAGHEGKSRGWKNTLRNFVSKFLSLSFGFFFNLAANQKNSNTLATWNWLLQIPYEDINQHYKCDAFLKIYLTTWHVKCNTSCAKKTSKQDCPLFRNPENMQAIIKRKISISGKWMQLH